MTSVLTACRVVRTPRDAKTFFFSLQYVHTPYFSSFREKGGERETEIVAFETCFCQASLGCHVCPGLQNGSSKFSDATRRRRACGDTRRNARRRNEQTTVSNGGKT